MTLIVVTDNTFIGNGIQVDLDIGATTDDVYVGAGYTVASQDNIAIQGADSGHTVNVQGTVIGALSAIALGNDAANDSGYHIVLGEHAYVATFSAADAAIELQGHSSQIDNDGTIHGEGIAIQLDGDGTGNSTIINNNGLIEGGSGIFRDNSAAPNNQQIILHNSGEIHATTSGIIGPVSYFSLTQVAVDTIQNSGLMVGSILLGAGDDSYDGTGGRVDGVVSGGAGVDSLTGGDFADRLDGNENDDTLFGAGGNDLLNGGFGADTMNGGAGNDTFEVENLGDNANDTGGGIDLVKTSVTYNFSATAARFGLDNMTMTGNANINGTGNALANNIQGNIGNNFVHGMAGNDTVNGNDGADRLWGEAGNDTLIGGNGADLLYGGLGNDKLTGGALNDKFYFDAKPGLLNRDTITDFQHGVDKIVLENAVFTGTGGGGLNPNYFFQGAAAHDANDRIIYNKATGVLSYDNDGTGAHAAIQFAVLGNTPALSAADFQVI